jgi:small subunit ribosomal protein S16
MSVVIRLRREGNINNPKYRIVVTDSRMPRDGRFIEILGNYDPKNEKSTKVNKEKANEWIKKGAKPSLRVASILKSIQ